MAQKYLIDCFRFLKNTFEPFIAGEYEIELLPDDMHTRHTTEFAWKNFWRVRKLYRSGFMRDYAVVHFNRAESFFQFKKIPGQVSIFEIHGFDVGILGEKYLNDLHTPWKRILGKMIDALITERIKQNIQKADIFYVSTPDLVEPIGAWCGRTPLWLPNAIDFSLFTPDGEKETLAGTPACFLAARLHGDKKPEVAFSLFKEHILPAYPDAVLHLIDTGELTATYKKELGTDPHYNWLGYMDKPTLARVIRGADLVFGDFSIGALSLLPMQVMAAERPIVSLDNHELLKVPVTDMPAYTLRLLQDKSFRADTVKKNAAYIRECHNAQNITKTHFGRIEKLR